MKVNVDPESGFCPGVVTAIRKAEDQLDAGGQLYCLGDIVHNNQEVERLQQKGLVTIGHEDLARLHGAKVLLRAHGEPPSTYRTASDNDIQIIDATCPVVLALQRKIHRIYEAEHRQGVQIVIFGKNGHAEVNGLVGQTDGNAIVIEKEDEDIAKVDFSRPVRLFSQTTMPVDRFKKLTAEIASRMQNPADFQSFDTICRQVANRIPHLRAFAEQNDVVIFVSGLKSSNGKALFEVCRQANPKSWFVSHPEDLTPEMTRGAETIGICGATSTPKWLMNAVAERLQNNV